MQGPERKDWVACQAEASHPGTYAGKHDEEDPLGHELALAKVHEPFFSLANRERWCSSNPCVEIRLYGRNIQGFSSLLVPWRLEHCQYRLSFGYPKAKSSSSVIIKWDCQLLQRCFVQVSEWVSVFIAKKPSKSIWPIWHPIKPSARGSP